MESTPQQIREILKISQEPVSLETPVGEDQDVQLGDFIEDRDAVEPHAAVSEIMRSEELCQALSTLTQRERKVIELRFGLKGEHPCTLEQVGQIFGVTRERIRRSKPRPSPSSRPTASRGGSGSSSTRGGSGRSQTGRRRAATAAAARRAGPAAGARAPRRRRALRGPSPSSDDVELLDLDLRDGQLGALSLETARVKGCRFDGAELRRLRCRQVVFETCDFANTRWFDCELRDVAFLDCRFVGASITGGGSPPCCCAIASPSWPSSRTWVARTRCSKAATCAARCSWRATWATCASPAATSRASSSLGVTLVGADLRGNELAGLKGVACLRGATIDALQLLALAPALAAHVGLVVEPAGIDA